MRELLNYDGASAPDDVPSLWGLTDGATPGGPAIKTSMRLRERKAGETGLYLGLAADSPAVDAAYAAALQAGGRAGGPPATRVYFSEGYYAANVIDFDGNRLESVNKSWNPKKPT